MAPESPDSQDSSHPRSHFHYHGCGHAFSANFTRPFHEQIDVQAGTALPPTGGHGSAHVADFQFRKFITFKRAYTHVSGGYQKSDNSNNTLVTSVIEGLNMLDILTADRIVARLYSKHRNGEAEGEMTMHGSHFVNLAISGQEVTVDLDFPLFEDIKTYKQAQTAYDSRKEFKQLAANPLGTNTEPLREQKCNGAFLTSLVKGGVVARDYPGGKSLPANPGDKLAGHCIYIPGFGKVFLAEVFISHGTRTLTMLRFELGSSLAGGGSAASATSNGRTWPPTG
jgi:hypothetical protein